MNQHQKTVMIIEDEADAAELFSEMMRINGFRVIKMFSSAPAIPIISHEKPDVILLDVMMPGMDGFEVCRYIRNDPLLAEIPIIMLTALDDRKSLLIGLEAGADDYITKPYGRYELRARLLGITRLNRYRKLLNERANLEVAHGKLLSAYDATIEGWSHAKPICSAYLFCALFSRRVSGPSEATERYLINHL